MKQIVHKLLILACALHLSGAHWAVLQMTAWAGMLVQRSQTSGVADALATTFDGQHPCGMCSAIESSQKKEKHNDAEIPALKALSEIKVVATGTVALPPRPTNGNVVWPDFLGFYLLRTEAPPVPPPLA